MSHGEGLGNSRANQAGRAREALRGRRARSASAKTSASTPAPPEPRKPHPAPKRFLLAKDSKRASRILASVLRAIFADYRTRARGCGVEGDTQCGAVTFVPRFEDAMNC